MVIHNTNQTDAAVIFWTLITELSIGFLVMWSNALNNIFWILSNLATLMLVWTELNSVACSPQANYTDRAAAAC
jgi:hypothetical protein